MLKLRPAFFVVLIFQLNALLAIAAVSGCSASDTAPIDPGNGTDTNGTQPLPGSDGGTDSAKDKDVAVPDKDANTKDVSTVDAKKDATENQPDGAPGTCTEQFGGGSGGQNMCTSMANYLCGADTREIECACPAAMCTCKVNNVVTKTFGTAHCPSCGPTKDELAKCGIYPTSGGGGGGGSSSGGGGP
jgi:hypothetical protein